MLIGYGRTSTIAQCAGLEAQVRDLEALGCERIYKEQVSSVAHRPQLEAAIDWAREGDAIVVTKLDRLARSVVHLGQIIERLERKGVGLRIIALGVDTTTATGKLMMAVMSGIAEFERAMMLERQKEGIAKAKSEGKYRGRQPTALAKSDQIKALAAEGLSMAAIAGRVGVGKSSVHRVLNG